MKTKILKFLILCLLASVMLFAVSCNNNKVTDQGSVSQSESPGQSMGSHEHVGGEATCMDKAECSLCNKKYGTVGQHNFVDEACTFCNRTASQGLEYRLSEDGTYYIVVGLGTCEDTEILMPTLYNGLPVKEIGPKAFAKLGDITKIEIGDCVEVIRTAAFDMLGDFESVSDTRVLGELIIPKSVNFIESEQQEKRREFVKVKYKGDLEDWCKIDFESASATFFQTYEHQEFYINGELLKEVVIPETITEIKPFAFFLSKISRLTCSKNTIKIGEGAFENCNYLIEVDLGGVQSIGKQAFAFCASLAKINVGANVTEIANEAFVSSPKIVEVINNSPHFTFEAGSSDHGNIAEYALSVANCDNNYKSKVSYENGYIIYDGNTLLGYEGDSVNLVVPEGIVSVYQWAFIINFNIETIVIPQSVVEIGMQAFTLTAINTVYYEGSLEDWLNISFDGYYANPLSKGASLYIENELVSDLVIPESVEEVTVQSIGRDAFYKCNNVSSIVIHNENAIIKADAFLNTAFYNDKSNWEYGCLYLGNSLLDATKVVRTTYKINDATTQIVAGAFKMITNMQNLVIPSSVQTIANVAFPTAGALKNVYYEGTAEEWQALIAHINANSILFKVTVYFYVENEANVPNDGGNYWHYDGSNNPVAW